MINNTACYSASIVLKKLREEVNVTFPKLPISKRYNFIAYHHASYLNLSDGGLQDTYLIIMTNDGGLKSSPVVWQLKRIKHVVTSTLVTEMLPLVGVAENLD